MKTIWEHRMERGWTQFDLGLKVGVQPLTVSLWERGQRLPRVVQMRKLGNVFGVCSDDIMLAPRGAPHHRPTTECGTVEPR
jgi:DNA-binding XRE family transcriptional regulator